MLFLRLLSAEQKFHSAGVFCYNTISESLFFPLNSPCHPVPREYLFRPQKYDRYADFVEACDRIKREKEEKRKKGREKGKKKSLSIARSFRRV